MWRDIEVVCSETTGHRWEHSFGSISGTWKKGARGRGRGFERAAGGVCELFSGGLPSAKAHSRQVLYDMLTQLLCHFLLIFLHKNVRRQAWGPPRGHPKRIPIPIISENLLSIRKKKKNLGRDTASLQSNLPAVLVYISSRKLLRSAVLCPFVLAWD